MAGFIKVEAEKLPVQALNTQINKRIFYDFKVKCKERGLPLNIVIEIFMNQYANGRYPLKIDDILKWKYNTEETETLNTTFNEEIYIKFKRNVKDQHLFVKHVIAAFIEDFTYNNTIFEIVKIN